MADSMDMMEAAKDADGAAAAAPAAALESVPVVEAPARDA